MNRSRWTLLSHRRIAWFVTSALAGALLTVSHAATGPKFLRDDPLTREPETQDASKVQEWTIDLFIDLTTNRPAGWTADIHQLQGNVGLADGSVQQLSSSRLQAQMAGTGDLTNRLAMPY